MMLYTKTLEQLFLCLAVGREDIRKGFRYL